MMVNLLRTTTQRKRPPKGSEFSDARKKNPELNIEGIARVDAGIWRECY
jgi:hypothetical protein